VKTKIKNVAWNFMEDGNLKGKCMRQRNMEANEVTRNIT